VLTRRAGNREKAVLRISATIVLLKPNTMFEKLKQFLADVSKEMKKVSWPTKEQLQESTLVVLAVCTIVTAVVFLIDVGMTKIVEWIF
jgi:preprotein translocase subunit SecE